jgi:hypothetical protein
LDRVRFLADLAGPTRQAFADDQRFCQASGAHGFPTFLIRAGGREHYNRFLAFAAVFDSLAGEPLEKNRLTISEGAVLDFIGKYGSAVAREVVEVFGVSDSEAEMIMDQLVSKGEIEARPAVTGTLYRALQSGEYCDPLTGGCM